MRIRWIPTLALVALTALACSKKEEAAPAAPTGPESGNEPVSAAPAAAAEPAKPYTGFDYDCGSGVTFNAKLDKGNALVTIDGKTATLTPQAGIGAMYTGEGLTYIPSGEEATLIREGQSPQKCKAKS